MRTLQYLEPKIMKDVCSQAHTNAFESLVATARCSKFLQKLQQKRRRLSYLEGWTTG